MQGIKKTFIICVLIIIIPAISHAAEYPQPIGFINDFANIIEPAAKAQLNNLATNFKKASGNEITVATVPTLDGLPIETYAVEMFEQWHIGEKGKDNGLLILLAPKEQRARIEVGYGLEPYINDALAGRIIRDTMIPHFKEGNFGLGLLNGAAETVSIIAKKTNLNFDAAAAVGISSQRLYHVQGIKKPPTLISKIFRIILVIFFILFFIKNPWAALFMLSMMGGRGGSHRGGFGGGFGGFGGGSSGGGGASGGW